MNPEIFETHASNTFVEAFAKGQHALAMRGKVGQMWRMFEPWKDEAKAYRLTLNTYIQPLIEEAIRRRDAKDIADVEKEDETLLDHLLRDSKGMPWHKVHTERNTNGAQIRKYYRTN